MRGDAVLFLCVANSARSQMAEGLARALAPPGVEVFSAGSAPTRLDPHAVAVLREVGIDTRGQRAKPLDEIPMERVGTVVTLCAEEVCPPFPPGVRRLHWPVDDPAAQGGPPAEVRRAFRRARRALRERLVELFGPRRRRVTRAPSRHRLRDRSRDRHRNRSRDRALPLYRLRKRR